MHGILLAAEPGLVGIECDPEYTGGDVIEPGCGKVASIDPAEPGRRDLLWDLVGRARR